MTARFINGASYAVGQLALAVAVSAISNADPAVVTSATVPADGSVVVLTSGWEELNETLARVTAGGAGVFSLEDINTTDLTRYPAGEGAGAYQLAENFVGLTQVRDVPMAGGDQNYFQYQYVGDKGGRQRQSPTFKSAMTMDILLDYDPDLPWYAALIELDRLRKPVVLRETLPAGDVIYYVGLLAFNKVPSKEINANMTVKASFSLQADPIRYGAV